MGLVNLEHINISVSHADKTAAWMQEVFGWQIRWSGPSIHNGRTVHIGEDEFYIALYSQDKTSEQLRPNYKTGKSLNHVGLTVTDLGVMKDRVIAAGFDVHSEQEYDPGKRFYFYDHDGVEYEIVSYQGGA